MNNNITKRFGDFIQQAPIWIAFILGLWLVIIRHFGPHFALLPGDLGDARFNNYLLEHFSRWISGVNQPYWNARFFYPIQGIITFGDNLLGSAPFYVVFRLIGLDRESAFQAWYILGFFFNYAAAVYVLSSLKLKPLAVVVGAFFFTFGLPLLAQENHVQLIYRFCIPLTCFLLWRFYQEPRLNKLVALVFFLVWQFYLTIYIGVFLSMLLAAMVVLLPFLVPAQTFWERIAIWPNRLKQSWSQAHPTGRTLAVFAILGLGISLVILLWPYFLTTKTYWFRWRWNEVSSMLPRLQSYLLADNSQLWKSTASIFSSVPKRSEHQLFPGIVVIVLVIVGILGRFDTINSRIAWLHFWTAVVLIALTLNINGFSLYRLMWQVPGVNSIRAVTRVQLVLMWPLALFIAWVSDALIRRLNHKLFWMNVIVYLMVGLLMAESIFYEHATFAKTDAQARLTELRQQIPWATPEEPILFVAWNNEEPYWVSEIDAMLLAQDLGWPTLNGYSGRFPPGYTPADSCKQLPQRINNYMYFANIPGQSYLEMMKNVVPIGFDDCDPVWWEKMP